MGYKIDLFSWDFLNIMLHAFNFSTTCATYFAHRMFFILLQKYLSYLLSKWLWSWETRVRICSSSFLRFEIQNAWKYTPFLQYIFMVRRLLNYVQECIWLLGEALLDELGALMEMTMENRSTRIETCPNVTLLITNQTCTGLGSSPFACAMTRIQFAPRIEHSLSPLLRPVS
jgi:hypothetical protein